MAKLSESLDIQSLEAIPENLVEEEQQLEKASKHRFLAFLRKSVTSAQWTGDRQHLRIVTTADLKAILEAWDRYADATIGAMTCRQAVKVYGAFPPDEGDQVYLAMKKEWIISRRLHPNYSIISNMAERISSPGCNISTVEDAFSASLEPQAHQRGRSRLRAIDRKTPEPSPSSSPPQSQPQPRRRGRPRNNTIVCEAPERLSCPSPTLTRRRGRPRLSSADRRTTKPSSSLLKEILDTLVSIKDELRQLREKVDTL